MKVLLVKPFSRLAISRHLMEYFIHLEPLELEIVAGGVPLEDEVEILDLSIEQEPFDVFGNKLRAMKPDIVGYTGFSSHAAIVKQLAAFAKKELPSTINIVGGIHATVVPTDYAVDGIDIIVRGEGGSIFGEIIKRFKTGMPIYFGQAVLSPNDHEFQSKAAAKLPSYPAVEDIPEPRRDLVDRSQYFMSWAATDEKRLKTIFPRIATIRTSYGCPFACSFCVVPHIMNGEYLQRSPEDVVSEIEKLKEKYIYFVDDENFINDKRMTSIANLLLQKGIKKKFMSWARSDSIVKHPEMFRLWKQAGLSMVYVGLEAMNGEQLIKLNKRTSVETNRKAVEVLREIGLTLHANFMVDPDYSEADFSELQKEVKNLVPAQITFTVNSPSPGTEEWNKQKERFILDPYDYYDCMHTILPTKLELRRFYQQFSDLYTASFRTNPLRVKKIKFPLKELFTVICLGVKYVIALRKLYKDYPQYKTV